MIEVNNMMVLAGGHPRTTFSNWAQKYGNLGNLYSPRFNDRTINMVSKSTPFALDNGKFSCWGKGYKWDADLFLKQCDLALKTGNALWIVVPDFPTEKERTIESWHLWEPKLRSFGVPLAFAVQDGMEPGDVPCTAEVIFVGGSTEWKVNTIPLWCRYFPRVHIARVNDWNRLWLAHISGAESCDGTGWFYGGENGRQAKWLHLYVRWLAGLVPEVTRVKNWPWVNPQTRLSLLSNSLQNRQWSIERDPLFADLLQNAG